MWLIVVVILAVLALFQYAKLTEILQIVSVQIFECFRYLRARNDIFKRIDVDGPTPTLLFGNLLEIYKTTGFNHPLITGMKKNFFDSQSIMLFACAL